MTDPVIAIDPEAPLGGGGEGGGSGGSGGSGGIEIGEELALLQGGSTSDIYVDREYVYVPSGASGYVDEFIGQIDRYQDLWYILQDVNYNVIALTDSGGDVVRQHTFDPYGEILTVEDFDAHPGIKVGHQGLFFDRLEPSAPILGAVSMGAAPQLQPGVFGLYQARNRVLLPRYGRWAQADPNGSGVLTCVRADGKRPGPTLAVAPPSIETVLIDGSNRFSFVQNDPVNDRDPLGLFGFVSGLMTGANLFDMATGALDEARQGISLAEQFVSTTADYAFEQMLMVDWALDWYADDRDLGLAEERIATGAGELGQDSRFAIAKSISYAKGPRPKSRGPGRNNHHIATHWGKRGKHLQSLFKSAGLDLHDTANVMDVMASTHRGRHTNKYHDMVLKDVETTLGATDKRSRARGLSGSELIGPRRDALRAVLEVWKQRIRENPGIMYIK